MKKIVALIVAVAVLLCLSSCGQSQHKDSLQSVTSSETQEATIAQDKLPVTQTPKEDVHNLTLSLFIDRINAYLAENDLASISNLETNPGENEGQIITTFSCIYELVNVSVTETNNVVDYIMCLCLPAHVIEKIPSKSVAEAAIAAYAYSMMPLFSCEPEIDSDWHQEQFTNAPDEGNSSIVIRSYTSEEWYYIAMIAESYVTCIAARYCSQCGSNAPTVTFSSNTPTCDSCNYLGQGSDNYERTYCKQCGADCTFRGVEEDGRCEDCYFDNNSGSSNISSNNNYGNNNSSNNASGNNPSPTVPAPCAHSYTDATCTRPKTCTKCGATTGSTLDHSWKDTSCTTPKACSVCGTTLNGSAPGHQWKNATCTQPETCSACAATQGSALGHHVELTKCSRCDHTNYSAIAKSYSNITAYDSKTGEDLIVTNVSISSSGVLSFIFNGQSYSITIRERTYDSMTYFDCYQNGSKLSNAECRIGDASYYNMLHFEWNGIDGHRLYFCAK